MLVRPSFVTANSYHDFPFRNASFEKQPITEIVLVRTSGEYESSFS